MIVGGPRRLRTPSQTPRRSIRKHRMPPALKDGTESQEVTTINGHALPQKTSRSSRCVGCSRWMPAEKGHISEAVIGRTKRVTCGSDAASESNSHEEKEQDTQRLAHCPTQGDMP